MDESELLERLVGRGRASDGTFAMPPESTFIVNENRNRVDDDRDPVDEWLRSTADELLVLLQHASKGSARHALKAIPLLRDRIEGLEREAVVVARRWGWSWFEIGYSLGVRAQTVHARHARVPRNRPRSTRRDGARKRRWRRR